MSFIRVKKIANGEYAYLVENKWTSKGSRQSSKKYLGKVITPEISKQVQYNTEKSSYAKQVTKL